MSDDLIQEAGGPREWLILKGEYFYRPKKSGYTTVKSQAGRYTELDARLEAEIEPWHMSAIHQDNVPDPAGDINISEIASLRDTLAANVKELAEIRAENERLRELKDHARKCCDAAESENERIRAGIADIELDIHLASGIAGYDLKPALAKIRSLVEMSP